MPSRRGLGEMLLLDEEVARREGEEALDLRAEKWGEM